MISLLVAVAAQRLSLPPAPSGEVMEQWSKDLRVGEKPLPPGQNGWSLAVAATTRSKKMRWPSADLLQRPDRKLDKKTAEQARQLITSWEPVLTNFLKAVARPHWVRSGSSSSEGPFAFPVFAAFKGINKILLFRARLDLYQGRSNQAVDDLRVSEEAGERVCAGDGPLTSELVGIAMLGLTDTCIRRLASDPNLSTKDLRHLLRMVPVDRGLAPLAGTIRCEVRDQLQEWSSEFHKTENLSNGDKASGIDRVLAGHPDPLDWRKTVGTFYALYEVALENTRRPWSRRVDVEARCQEAAKALPPRFGDLLAPDSDKPISYSDNQVAALRSSLLTVPNPVGLWLSTISVEGTTGAEVAERRNIADIRATAIVVANQIYRRRFGRDVRNLSDLTRSGILDSIPIDPFADRPLRFDASKRQISSVGPGTKSSEWASRRFAWSLDGSTDSSPPPARP